ncbi:MAG: hypothetical protein CMJ25_17575 [Phycisphaerae bacterium]|nr:hypothetical protein [Phycisphaerae bacterium]
MPVATALDPFGVRVKCDVLHRISVPVIRLGIAGWFAASALHAPKGRRVVATGGAAATADAQPVGEGGP